MIAFSGVRSSCDMLARNSDLCRLATSSCPALVLDLVEQAHVLDGDHGLVGECLHERDLFVRERAHEVRAITVIVSRLACLLQ